MRKLCAQKQTMSACAHTGTTPGSACSHVSQGIIFSPCFYLNPDLVQHWETTLAFLLTAVNQRKEHLESTSIQKVIQYHQHFWFWYHFCQQEVNILEISCPYLYLRVIKVICFLSSGIPKEGISYPLSCQRCAWMSRDSWK